MRIVPNRPNGIGIGSGISRFKASNRTGTNLEFETGAAHCISDISKEKTEPTEKRPGNR